MSSVTSSSSSSSSLRSSSSSSEFALGQYQSSLGTLIPWKEKKPQLGDTLCQRSIIFLLSLVRDWLERDLLLTLALWCAEESIRSYTHNSFHLLTVKLFTSSLTPLEVSFNLSLLSFRPYSWPENAKKRKRLQTQTIRHCYHRRGQRLEAAACFTWNLPEIWSHSVVWLVLSAYNAPVPLQLFFSSSLPFQYPLCLIINRKVLQSFS